MADIQVLMCGGRRTGKTSIMAAIQANVMQSFPRGDIGLDMENSGHLTQYRTETTKIFGYDYEDEDTFLADQGSNSDSNNYPCKVYLQKRAAGMNLLFTDVPGEWFIDPDYDADLDEKLQTSQILIIAVDSPHMMEDKGKYHEVFNRVERLTSKITKAFQGNKVPRMVLFVPVKCERYRATQDHNRNRMPELLQAVKTTYSNLISFLTTGANKQLYTVAVAPCFTFGGAEYLRFLPPLDEDGKLEIGADGKPLKDLEIDPKSGLLTMQWLTQYRLLTDEYGDHYYQPENCEQSLIYILLFLIAVRQQKVDGVMKNILADLLRQANQNILVQCKGILLQKIKKQDANGNSEEGFAVLNDPLRMTI